MKRITSIKRELFNPNRDKKILIYHKAQKIAFLYSDDVDTYIPTPCVNFSQIQLDTEDCKSDFQRWEESGYELLSITQTEFEKVAASMITSKTADDFWESLVDGFNL